MSTPSDEIRELVARCLSGDQAAIVALVERYQGQVFGLCFRMLGQRQDAEDAAQETFLRVVRNLEKWDSQREFEPWLLAIAGNRCRTALARRGRRPRNETLLEQIVPDETPSPHDADQLAEEVRLAMEGLRPEHQQAFLLFHEQELSYQEIAASLECPLGTIKTWVHRARKHIVEQLRRRQVVQEPRHALQ